MILAQALISTHQIMMLHPLASLAMLLYYALLLGLAWSRFVHIAFLLPRPTLILFPTSVGKVLVKVRLELLEVRWIG